MQETARERECDLILLGWKGYTSTARKIMGDVVDDIVKQARTDILLLKQVENGSLRRILLPTAGGEHARCAEKYAASIARYYDGSISVCSVISPEADEDTVKQVTNRLNLAVRRLDSMDGIEVHRKTIRQKSVSVGIIRESRKYDALMIGASGRSIYPQILFGSIPEMIAKRCDRSVILVKRYHPVKELIGRVMEE